MIEFNIALTFPIHNANFKYLWCSSESLKAILFAIFEKNKLMEDFNKLSPEKKLNTLLKFVCTQPHKSFSLTDMLHHINGKYQTSNIRKDVILMIATQLVEDKNLNHVPREEIKFSDKQPIFFEEYYVTTFKGELFDIDGGYLRLKKRETKRNIWMTAKIAAAIFNAIMILSISIWSVYVATQSLQQNEETTILKHQNDSLKIVNSILSGKRKL